MTSRMGKEMFTKLSPALVILKYACTPDVCGNFLSKFSKGSRSLWNENRERWINWLLESKETLFHEHVSIFDKLAQQSRQLYKHAFKTNVQKENIEELARVLDNSVSIDIVSIKIDFCQELTLSQALIQHIVCSADDIICGLKDLCEAVTKHKIQLDPNYDPELCKIKQIDTIRDKQKYCIVTLPTLFNLKNCIQIDNAIFVLDTWNYETHEFIQKEDIRSLLNSDTLHINSHDLWKLSCLGILFTGKSYIFNENLKIIYVDKKAVHCHFENLLELIEQAPKIYEYCIKFPSKNKIKCCCSKIATLIDEASSKARLSICTTEFSDHELKKRYREYKKYQKTCWTIATYCKNACLTIFNKNLRYEIELTNCKASYEDYDYASASDTNDVVELNSEFDIEGQIVRIAKINIDNTSNDNNALLFIKKQDIISHSINANFVFHINHASTYSNFFIRDKLKLEYQSGIDTEKLNEFLIVPSSHPKEIRLNLTINKMYKVNDLNKKLILDDFADILKCALDISKKDTESDITLILLTTSIFADLLVDKICECIHNCRKISKLKLMLCTKDENAKAIFRNYHKLIEQMKKSKHVRQIEVEYEEYDHKEPQWKRHIIDFDRKFMISYQQIK